MPQTTDDRHDSSWAANLEHPRHAESERRGVEDALDAVGRTDPGHHGRSETYLFPALEDAYGDDARWEFVDRCGCGGYVTRVFV